MHSIIKLPDLNCVTFITSPTQPLTIFSITNGEIFVRCFSLEVKAINLHQFSTSNSPNIFSVFFGGGGGGIRGRWILILRQKRPHGFIYNSLPSLSPPTTECQHGDTWILRISFRKYQEFQRWYILEPNNFLINASFVSGLALVP